MIPAQQHHRPRPYVGISGVVSTRQQDALMAGALIAGVTPHRDLLLGVKATHKTQMLDVANKYGPEWYPIGAHGLAGALRPRAEERENLLAVAQVYLDVEHVHDADYRRRFMDTLTGRGGAWLDAVQFDMLPWHDDAEVAAFVADVKDRYGLKVLVQCHGPAMKTLGPDGAANALGRLAEGIDYVLFDSSHGTGTRLDVETLASFVESAYSASALDDVGVAVAGGLTAEVVTEDLPPLLARFPDLSWDAEGGLHPVGADGTRPLHMGRVNDYLRASGRVCRAAAQDADVSAR